MACVPHEIRGTLIERFVFNYRLDPCELRRRLPVPWLEPLLVKGHAVGSFCILSLKGLTVGGVPFGASNVHCAYRYGVVDDRTGERAVYIDQRCTNSRLGSFITSLGFPCFHPHVDVRIAPSDDAWAVRVKGILDAEVSTSPLVLSNLFEDCEAFSAFLRAGVRSYNPSTYGGLSVVDLIKDEHAFEALAVHSINEKKLTSMGAEFDSAFRTCGGTYSWRFEGHLSLSQQPAAVAAC